jgi:hypothetical protein
MRFMETSIEGAQVIDQGEPRGRLVGHAGHSRASAFLAVSSPLKNAWSVQAWSQLP